MAGSYDIGTEKLKAEARQLEWIRFRSGPPTSARQTAMTVGGQQFGQVLLVDGNVTAQENGTFLAVIVDGDNLVTHIREHAAAARPMYPETMTAIFISMLRNDGHDAQAQRGQSQLV